MRAQTAVIAVSPVQPGVAFTVWFFETGAFPADNLTPFVFPLRLAFDTYAFFRRNPFELTPRQARRRPGGHRRPGEPPLIVGAVDPGRDRHVMLDTPDGRREYTLSEPAVEEGSTATSARGSSSTGRHDRTAPSIATERPHPGPRHNPRNDLNVVQGNLDLAAERTDDEDLESLPRGRNANRAR